MTTKKFGKYPVTNPKPFPGGMSDVWIAEHPDLGTPRAIKVPHPQHVYNFAREAKRTSNLRHPNIILVHDADFGSDPPYMVLEYLPDSVKKRLEDNEKIDWERVIEFGIDTCKALTYAHTRDVNVIHQDIKPGNLLLGEDGGLKVCDFGVSVGLRPSSLERIRGLPQGTYEYMAPERWDGNDPDAQADIYSLGCTLYQLLTGEYPYPGGNVLRQGIRHQEELFPNLPDDLGIPTGLKDVIYKATKKEPSLRYATADDMREALEDVSEGDLQAATKLGPDSGSSAAVEEFDAMASSAESALSDMVLDDELAEHPSVIDYIEQQQPFPPGPNNEARSISPDDNTARGYNFYEAGEYVQAISAFTDSLRIDGFTESLSESEDLPSFDAADVARINPALFGRACCLYRIEDFKRALDDFSGAIALDPDNPFNYLVRGDIHRQAYLYEQAIDDFNSTIDLGLRDSFTLLLRGTIFVYLGDDHSAISDLSEAIALGIQRPEAHYIRGLAYQGIGESTLAVDDLSEFIGLSPEDIRGYTARGHIYLEQEEYLSAANDFAQVSQLDPPNARAFKFRGLAHAKLERYSDAVNDFSESVRVSPMELEALIGKGIGLSKTDQHLSAIQDFTIAIESNIVVSAAVPGVPRESFSHMGTEFGTTSRMMRLYLLRANSYRALKEYGGALSDLDSAMSLGDGDTLVLYDRGLVHLAQAQVDREFSHFEAAAKDLTESLRLRGPNVPFGDGNRGLIARRRFLKRTLATYYYLAEAQIALGEHQIALENYSAALEIDPRDGELYRLRGAMYALLGRIEESIQDLQSCISCIDDPESLPQGPHVRDLYDVPRRLMPTRDLRPSEQIGNYEITEYLGRGGLGSVYSATAVAARSSLLQRDVIIKKAHATTSQMATALEHEADLLARSAHPNVEEIYDVISDETGIYFVYEYLTESLADRIRLTRPSLSTSEFFNIVNGIAQGLGFIHSQGLVHGDLKPSNILLTNELVPKLTGIINLGIPGESDWVGPGTPEYMAQEHWRGENVDHRADIYSFGCTLFEMITRRPLVRENVTYSPLMQGNDFNEMYQWLEEGRVPTLRFHLMGRRMPVALERIVHRAMAKEPRDRFQSAGEMAQAIQEVMPV